MKHVDLAGLGMEASSGTPIVLLREHDEPHRVLPIFIGGSEAVAIAAAASGEASPRPLTHDLTATLLRRLGARIDAVEVTAVADGTYYAEIALDSDAGPQRVDARPSDAIALALRFGATLLVSDEVLEEAAAVVVEGTEREDEHDAASDAGEPMDPAAIDSEVEQFRSFLDHVDASAFAIDGGEGSDGNEGPGDGEPDHGGGDPGTD